MCSFDANYYKYTCKKQKPLNLNSAHKRLKTVITAAFTNAIYA